MTTADRQRITAVLRSLAPLPDGKLAEAVSDFTPRALKPGDHLLRPGDRAHLIALIDRGLVREYYVGRDGDEHVRTFCTEGQFTGSLYDLLSQAPALAGIEALEPTRLLVCEWSAFQARCDEDPAWHIVGRRVAEGLYVRKSVREHQMLALTAAERFAALERDHPDLEVRVSGRHLASYLGITPEHLSRIRARAGRRRATGSRRAR